MAGEVDRRAERRDQRDREVAVERVVEADEGVDVTDLKARPVIGLRLRKTSCPLPPVEVTCAVIVVSCPALIVAGVALSETPTLAFVCGTSTLAKRTSG